MKLFHKKTIYKMKGMVYDATPHGAIVDFLNEKGQKVSHFVPLGNLRIGEIITVRYERL